MAGPVPFIATSPARIAESAPDVSQPLSPVTSPDGTRPLRRAFHSPAHAGLSFCSS